MPATSPDDPHPASVLEVASVDQRSTPQQTPEVPSVRKAGRAIDKSAALECHGASPSRRRCRSPQPLQRLPASRPNSSADAVQRSLLRPRPSPAPLLALLPDQRAERLGTLPTSCKAAHSGGVRCNSRTSRCSAFTSSATLVGTSACLPRSTSAFSRTHKASAERNRSLHGPLADLRRKSVRRLADTGSTFSGAGACGNSNARRGLTRRQPA